MSVAGRRPVSRAHRSTLLHRQTEERPSLPSGSGKPGPLARTFTRCGEMPSRFAMSDAITSSVRESIRTSETLPSAVVLNQPRCERPSVRLGCWSLAQRRSAQAVDGFPFARSTGAISAQLSWYVMQRRIAEEDVPEASGEWLANLAGHPISGEPAYGVGPTVIASRRT
jgi:hypothetical protein